MPTDGLEKMLMSKQDISINQNMPMRQDMFMNRLRKCCRNGRELISSLLFPRRCPICDEILSPEEADKGIHPACENKLYPVAGAVCMHCGRPLGQLNPQSKPKKQIQSEDHIHNEKKIGFEFSTDIPLHLRVESSYEYCQECRRKGYVSEFANRSYHKTPDVQSGCDVFLNSASYITQAKSLYLYRGAIKTTMYRFKYANKREYAVFFARKAVERYGAWFGIGQKFSLSPVDKVIAATPFISQTHGQTAPFSRFDVIIPVPMYRSKQKQRGYNQAETFAAELSHLTGIPVDAACIRRIKDTTPQKNLKDIERKNNLENAFQITKSIVKYNRILLVDDIYTTGYTAEMVAKEIIKQGKQKHRVYLLSICIGGSY